MICKDQSSPRLKCCDSKKAEVCFTCESCKVSEMLVSGRARVWCEVDKEVIQMTSKEAQTEAAKEFFLQEES